MTGTRRLLYGAVPALLLLSACGSDALLQPAPEARTAAEAQQMAAAGSDVRLTATAVEWPGDVDISSEVTPLRVSLRNNSDRPLSFEYANLRLVAPNGATYSALPVYQIQGEGEETVRVAPPPPLDRPGFSASRFSIAPYYERIYPNYPVYGDPFYADPGYYKRYETVEVQLPTPEMKSRALPEGVVEPGGNIDGWVFFEKVPEDLERVDLRADVEDARTGRTIAELRIPFLVQG